MSGITKIPKKSKSIADEIPTELIAAIRAGDSEAFGRYYMGFADSLVRFLITLLGDEEDAREITQDVFTALWENRESLNPEKSLNGFVFGTAKNMAYNMIRRRKTQLRYGEELAGAPQDYDTAPDEIFISQETTILFNEILREMPPQRRKVFEMSRYEGRSYGEIARELGLSPGTVQKHMKLALKDIRQALTTFIVLLLLG